MFHEHREIIATLKVEDKYFKKIFEKHNELDEEIATLVKTHSDEFEIERMKKEKLKLKDQIYTYVVNYQKENNL
ncbi:MAG: YdcH family protein [Candidatus Marinarcus sp.]|uniref:YdcH family protein n=1 Tax=Candidatus Marinarcus sp. TaxID=3100987 RepID=UPI003AFFA600